MSSALAPSIKTTDLGSSMARKAAGAEGDDDGFECNDPSRVLIEGKCDDMSVWHETISDMKRFFAIASSRLTAKSQIAGSNHVATSGKSEKRGTRKSWAVDRWSVAA